MLHYISEHTPESQVRTTFPLLKTTRCQVAAKLGERAGHNVKKLLKNIPFFKKLRIIPERLRDHRRRRNFYVYPVNKYSSSFRWDQVFDGFDRSCVVCAKSKRKEGVYVVKDECYKST